LAVQGAIKSVYNHNAKRQYLGSRKRGTQMKYKKIKIFLISLVIAASAFILLYPTCPAGGPRAQALSIANRGRQIFLALFEASMEAEDEGKEYVWPIEGEYKTSTEFFKAIVSNNYIYGIDFTFFGGTGLKIPKDTTDPTQFTAANNAWGVVVQSTNTLINKRAVNPEDIPFMFSRNIGFGSPPGPPQPDDTIADMTGLRKGVKPLGDRLGVIITYGGKVKLVTPNSVLQTNLNPKVKQLKFIMP